LDRSSSLGEAVLHRFLESQELLYAGSVLHPLEVCDAVLEPGEIDLELPGSPLAPEEMRVRRREVIEEEITPSQKMSYRQILVTDGVRRQRLELAI
jgi:hypothetical protein